mmetsp:Transcript_28876/g.33184  ORF Transcript_28876/g.33184 Transcript_28876/m.33184 type:complete len:96 (+) Transcript_28876:334-621(+)
MDHFTDSLFFPPEVSYRSILMMCVVRVLCGSSFLSPPYFVFDISLQSSYHHYYFSSYNHIHNIAFFLDQILCQLPPAYYMNECIALHCIANQDLE